MCRIFILITAMLMTCTVFGGEGRTESDKTREFAGSGKRNHVLPPVSTEKYEYHEVCGCCEKDLQCEMMDKAIRWKDGSTYDSITKWRMKWDYAYDRDAHACRTDSFRVSADITIQLPKWVCAGHAPPALTKKWENYIANLSMHEKGHRDKVLKAAAELTRAVAEMSPAANCSELDRRVQRLCSERMKQLDDEQEAYDAATEHGHVRDVAFP